MTNHAQQAASLLAISLGIDYHASFWRRLESPRLDQSNQVVITLFFLLVAVAANIESILPRSLLLSAP